MQLPSQEGKGRSGSYKAPYCTVCSAETAVTSNEIGTAETFIVATNICVPGQNRCVVKDKVLHFPVKNGIL